MTIHEKLRRLTKLANRSAVCREAGLATMTLANIIVRGSTPGADTAAKLARALGVDPGWLIDDRREWPPIRIAPSGDEAETQELAHTRANAA